MRAAREGKSMSELVLDASVAVDLLARFRPEPIETLLWAEDTVLAAHSRGPACPSSGPCCQAFTSKTMLNGVCAASLKREKPPSRTTRSSCFGPACAPRANPTSWLMDAGVQIIVENA